MLLAGKKWLFALIFLAFFLLGAHAQMQDSDNDSIPDEQELADGTNPNDAQSNLLQLRVEGLAAVGEKVEISLWHPSLGTIEGVDFSVEAIGYEKEFPSSSIVEYEVVKSGLHTVRAKKGAFSVHTEFIPVCKTELASFGGFSSQFRLMLYFLSLAIGVLGFTAFRRLLETMGPDYPPAQFPVFFSAYFGFSLSLISLFLSLSLEIIPAMFTDLVLVLLLVASVRFLKGKEKMGKGKAGTKTHEFFSILPFPAERFFGKVAPHKRRAMEMEKMKRQISKKVERFRIASSAQQPGSRQHALDMAREGVSSLNSYLLSLVGAKKPPEEEEEVKKTPQQIVEERRIESMIQDIEEQLLKEDKEGGKVAEEGEAAPEKKPKILSRLKLPKAPRLIGKFIQTEESAKKADYNTVIELQDELGNPLDAKKPEFFVLGKKVKSAGTEKNKAFFKLKPGNHPMFVRLLGFLDLQIELSVSKTPSSFSAKMSHDLVISVTDAEDKPLDDAFINITTGNKKVVDIHSNFIWKTPAPEGAPQGTAFIPVNPLHLKGKMLSIKAVKANYSKKELLIPSNRVSSAEQLKKTISLERIVKA